MQNERLHATRNITNGGMISYIIVDYLAHGLVHVQRSAEAKPARRGGHKGREMEYDVWGILSHTLALSPQVVRYILLSRHRLAQ